MIPTFFFNYKKKKKIKKNQKKFINYLDDEMVLQDYIKFSWLAFEQVNNLVNQADWLGKILNRQWYIDYQVEGIMT